VDHHTWSALGRRTRARTGSGDPGETVAFVGGEDTARYGQNAVNDGWGGGRCESGDEGGTGIEVDGGQHEPQARVESELRLGEDPAAGRVAIIIEAARPVVLHDLVAEAHGLTPASARSPR